MMHHYNELYLNKFNTPLIKEESARKGHTRIGTHHLRVLAQGEEALFHGGGGGCHFKQIFIYIFI